MEKIFQLSVRCCLSPQLEIKAFALGLLCGVCGDQMQFLSFVSMHMLNGFTTDTHSQSQIYRRGCRATCRTTRLV